MNAPRHTPLERRIRELAQARFRDSPELDQSFRQEQRSRRKSPARVILRMLTVCFLIAYAGVMLTFMVLAGIDKFGVDGMLVLHSQIALCMCCLLANSVFTGLKNSLHLSIFSHTPAADRHIGWVILREWSGISLLYAFADLLFYGLLATRALSTIHWWQIGLIIAGQAAIRQATIVLLMTWIPDTRRKQGLVLLLIAIAACIWLAPAQLLATESIMFLLLPTGWMDGILSLSIIHQQAIYNWLLVPAGGWCLLGLISHFVLLDVYRIEGFLLRAGLPAVALAEHRAQLAVNPAAEALAWHAQTLADEAGEDLHALSMEELSSRVRNSDFLTPQDWSRLGWIERVVDRVLNARERVILEFLTAEQIQWSAVAKAALIQVIVLMVIGGIWGNIASMMPAMGFMALFTSLSGPWPAFRTRPVGGTHVAQIELFPVDRDEIVRTFMKVSAVRSVAAIPLLAIPCVWMTRQRPLWPFEGLLTAVTFGVMLFIMLRWQVDHLLSLGTTFPDGSWRNVMRRAGHSVLTFAASVSAIVVMVLLTSGLWHWPLPVAVGCVLFFTVLRGYLSRKYYRQGQVDLVRASQSFWEKRVLEPHEQTYLKSKRMIALRKNHGPFWWLKLKRQQDEQPDTVLPQTR